VHISLGALLRAWGGQPAGSSASTSASRSATDPAGDASAMEGIAAVLGPPDRPFRPPCRMLTPA
jgi:hypothetical protein